MSLPLITGFGAAQPKASVAGGGCFSPPFNGDALIAAKLANYIIRHVDAPQGRLALDIGNNFFFCFVFGGTSEAAPGQKSAGLGAAD